MTKKHKPGDIVAARRLPRNEHEILCHNHVLFNGFRWFTARRGGEWRVCPCGWRPELGVHYAQASFVKRRRDLKKKLGGTWEDVESYIRKRAFNSMPVEYKRTIRRVMRMQAELQRREARRTT
jgi:hypothetical protein